MRSSFVRYIVLLGTGILFVGAWWAIAESKHNFSQFAGPPQTFVALESVFTNSALSGLLVPALENTMVAIFLGFSLAVIVGIPIGVLMGRYIVADLVLDPWVNAWYSVPAVAFVPLVMNWTGLNYGGSIIIAFLIAVFSVTLNVYSGIKNCNATLLDTAASYRASELQLLYKVMLPASLPRIFVGLRLGLSRAIEGVIISEMFYAAVGLGGVIDYSADHLQSATSDALILILVAISLALTGCLRIIDRKMVSWKETDSR